MQSGLTAASQKPYSTRTPEDTTNTISQHGLRYASEQPPRLPRDEDRGDPQSGPGSPACHAAVLQDSGASQHMSDETTPHEVTSTECSDDASTIVNAPLKPGRRLQEPSLSASRAGNSGSAEGSSLAALPTEVLVHVLSYLPPSSLSAVALVSWRFYSLVTSPHAWRMAFCRFFPGQDSISARAARAGSSTKKGNGDTTPHGDAESRRRMFTRLTPLASWRSEYILRTGLLRCLARGKPAELLRAPSASSGGRARSSGAHLGGRAAVTFNSGIHSPITHLHALFPPAPGARVPRFIVGAGGIGAARRTDTTCTKVEAWGSADLQLFLQFNQRFAGEAPWGLGAGDMVGVPNVMDLSAAFGMVHGEGYPGGSVYLRCANEKRGRFLLLSMGISAPHLGIPVVSRTHEAICAVWIAKSANILSITEGLVGVLSGSSCGVLTAYSLGTDDLTDQRLTRGEVTARWVLSPGVPIIAIAVDEHFSETRLAERRSWAVVLNALGEVYHLVDLPKRHLRVSQPLSLPKEAQQEFSAWETGRSVDWHLVESSKRTARVDPYKEPKVGGRCALSLPGPAMALDKEQLVARTAEVQRYLSLRPKDFRAACVGWDMRRKLEVDFAGGAAGILQSFVVVTCGGEDREPTQLKRYVRYQTDNIDASSLKAALQSASMHDTLPAQSAPDGAEATMSKSNSCGPHHEWRATVFGFGSIQVDAVTASAVDNSMFAQVTASEDPLMKPPELPPSDGSAADAQLPSPQSQPSTPTKTALLAAIPGQRARFMAVGTNKGDILVWDMRGPTAAKAELVNTLAPVRVIRTRSAYISCLAMTALYLVHGAGDGLVQAWDPLASTEQPLKTLSGSAARSRRRLEQALPPGDLDAGGAGVGGAADDNSPLRVGAICLDPDPTVLRGMVALGSQLRYWSYSSSSATGDASLSGAGGRARRLRRGPRRRSNNITGGAGDAYTDYRRSSVENFIVDEQREFVRDQAQRRREAGRLAGRFGVGLLGAQANDDDMLSYALLLSAESYTLDEEPRRQQRRRRSDEAVSSSSGSGSGSSSSSSGRSSDRNSRRGSSGSGSSGGSGSCSGSNRSNSRRADDFGDDDDDDVDNDLAEALRLSLLGSGSGSGSAGAGDATEAVAAGYPSVDQHPLQSSPQAWAAEAGAAADDVEFALQLSLAEERSRQLM